MKVTRWQLIHTYFKLAEEGKENKLTCPDDNGAYYISFSNDPATPSLVCTFCQARVTPGDYVWSEIYKAVRRHVDVELVPYEV